MSRLKYNFDQIIQQVNLIRPPLVIVYTDMIDNNNVIYVPNITSYTEFLDATKPYDPIVIDISDPSASQKLAQSRRRRNVNPPSLKVKVLGGDGLYNDRAGSCSVGLWVYDNDGFYIITAGHCYEPGVWFHQPWGHNGPSLSIGSMVFDSKNVDFGVIFREGENVAPTFIINNDESEQFKELIITGSEVVSSHDVHICKSGYKTRLTCANVFGINGVWVSLDGRQVLYDLIITGLRADTGDSGGSVLSFVSPQDLDLVVVHGIHITGGAAAEPIDQFQ
ncbi:hypothetical protein C2G38_2033293 [Gigaspora rosea]|uniref:Trypsin-like cysteine/serine peptidase domain-containing protein n=1 Tax=Gigaspora rosea TaxID=44941 RepID=A0A397VLD6_9GLOM|nr:hypothetical protein C2G38_2033293 [Gigaspora rosea]